MTDKAIVQTKGLDEEFLTNIMALPNGEKVKLCIQCGTCGGSCPTSYAMDYTPREVIANLRARMLDRVLGSQTVWLCSSCYSCTVRCPQKIPFTDLMYELKRLSIKHGIYPKGSKAVALQKTFVGEVDKYGRNPDGVMMRKFYMRAGIFEGLRNLPLALRMFQKGRLNMGAKRIKGQEQLAAITKRAEEISR